MRVIRENVFETNSSSVHAICINNHSYSGSYLDDKGNITDKWKTVHKVTFKRGNFGWPEKVIDSSTGKASYLFEAIIDLYGKNNEVNSKEDLSEEGVNVLNQIESILKSHGVEVEYDFKSNKNDSYGIDHGASELGGFVSDILSEEKLLNYLYDENSFIYTGNDNGPSMHRVIAMNSLTKEGYTVYTKGN